MNRIYLFFIAVISSQFAIADISSCLISSYSEIVKVKNGEIFFRNGKTQEVGEIKKRSFTDMLASPSVLEQFSIKYSKEFFIPKQYNDPGRIRNDEFFKNLYGQNQREILNNLVDVYWKPSNRYVQFNRLNGAAEQLWKVGEEIATYPELISYVNNTLGTFNFRNIAGTKRLSAHSFGVAIDFALPKHLHKYWRWDGCKSEEQACSYPQKLMKDNKLKLVVNIFEKYGFIWGGKWASYDSVHFEYRPEMLNSQCHF